MGDGVAVGEDEAVGGELCEDGDGGAERDRYFLTRILSVIVMHSIFRCVCGITSTSRRRQQIEIRLAEDLGRPVGMLVFEDDDEGEGGMIPIDALFGITVQGADFVVAVELVG